MPSSHLVFDEWEDLYADRVEHLRRSAVRDLFAAISRPNVIGLSGGSPDISSLPLDEVAECAKRVVTENGLKSLQYGGSDGRIETRAMVAGMLAEDGIHVDPDEIIITGGSQQALDFMGRVFINPGDKIIVEGPSYLGALQAFSAYQPDVEVVPMDDEGMRMDALEETLKRLGPRGAKFIYTIPNFQNPAGVTMTLERRKRLLELAHEYDIQVIEDDPYGRLRFEGEHIAPLKSMDPNVIYLGTTSKIFAPGLRLAWCVAPKPVLAKINLCEQGASLCCSAFNQILAEQYFTNTDWKGTLVKSRAIYRSRRDAMISALEEFFPPEATWTHPEGGLFVYVTLPPYFDTEQMMSAALENGVAYVPGTNCFPDGQGRSSMRLAFSYEPEDKIREGIRRLSEVIADRMELYRAFLKAGALPETPRKGM
ncbi:PLP-dependent aminotransferase family protein [Coriobacteriaceae bacterium]|uniref:GntR family transcriptional regulator n=1 Tax=Granulimonas faecalis TaxID=2894155 RepID=A0AAV5B6I4_9ACTN|nr:PLP-dependent aminotransferase family protein [Granulimonas faecalis]TGY57850.1 PLP-dependent aminotransferase family protein [Coriobacteriaceae bacterium]GJM55949.1 GntR family transcriptional regulator [Granulimonas faecalis]